MSKRLAILIGNDEYIDPKLAELEAVRADLAGLNNTLGNPTIGHFDEVKVLINKRFGEIQEDLAAFYMQEKSPDDLILVYFSGHGILDRSGDLYLAVSDTKYELPLGTSISASFLRELMAKSRSKRQVLILDCCHSGAFGRAKGALGVKTIDKNTFSSQGYALEVLTASDATQLAWENENVIGDPNQQSVFTQFLVEGMLTGKAGEPDSEEITVEQLYRYAHDKTTNTVEGMEPQRYSYNQRGSIVIARHKRNLELEERRSSNKQAISTSFTADILRLFGMPLSKKARLTSILTPHVGYERAKKLSKTGEDILKPCCQEMTVLFADIRSFTSISEVLGAEDLSFLLAEYFSVFTDIIFQYRGTLDKFVGDMVMAHWGTLDRIKEHAYYAVAAALAMRSSINTINTKLITLGYPQVQVGIGLSTGEAFAGNFGSSQRIEYSVIGDSVNLGSRLEGLTKFYGATILLNKSTMKQAKGIVFREVDLVRVKGKSLPDSLYEPIGFEHEVSNEMLVELGKHHAALSHFRAQRWDESEAIFRELSKSSDFMTLYHIYLDRISSYRECTLDPDWDGVYTHTTK